MHAVVTDTMMRSPEIAAALAAETLAAVGVTACSDHPDRRHRRDPSRRRARRADRRRGARAQDTPLLDGDCLVVTQKIVSKAEDRLVPLDPDDLDARRALVESESVRIVRRRGDLIISETRHGFVCANAGIDLSNVEHGWAALLPVDSDRSAKHIRDALRARVRRRGRGDHLRHVRAAVAAAVSPTSRSA